MGFVFQFLSSLIMFVNIARTIPVKEYGKLELKYTTLILIFAIDRPLL